MFFLTLFFLGIDSAFSLVEASVTALADSRAFSHIKQMHVALAACIIGAHTDTLTHKHTHTHTTHTHTHTRANTHVHTHANTHTRKHTHTGAVLGAFYSTNLGLYLLDVVDYFINK
jgi:SNF family Na+-dependent transporter